jgi:hypothetical protein
MKELERNNEFLREKIHNISIGNYVLFCFDSRNPMYTKLALNFHRPKSPLTNQDTMAASRPQQATRYHSQRTN